MKQLLWYLIAGTRGGETRGSIIAALEKRPANAHQLSKTLVLDYKTIQHHLRILLQNNILQVKGKYGAVYFLSESLEEYIDLFHEIWAKFGNKSGKG